MATGAPVVFSGDSVASGTAISIALPENCGSTLTIDASVIWETGSTACIFNEHH